MTSIFLVYIIIIDMYQISQGNFFFKNQVYIQIVAFFRIFWLLSTFLLPDMIIHIQNLNFLAIFILINTLLKSVFWKLIKGALKTSVECKLDYPFMDYALPYHPAAAPPHYAAPYHPRYPEKLSDTLSRSSLPWAFLHTI